MIRLKQLTPELEELYGVSEEKKILNDPDFIALRNGKALYDVTVKLGNIYNTPDDYNADYVENVKNLLRKYRPEAKKILDARAKALAQIAGLSDYRMGYFTSQYFLLLAIFKDETGVTCGYRLYDELRDSYNDYTAESVIARLKEHSVRIHNMFLIDDNVYILNGEDAYTHLGTDGSVLEVPFVRLGKKGGEVITKSTTKQKRTPLVFLRRLDDDYMLFLDYEGNLVCYYGLVYRTSTNYTKILNANRSEIDTQWIIFSFSKGTNLSATTVCDSNRVSMLPTEVNSDYSREIVPYYFNLATSSELAWAYPCYSFYEAIRSDSKKEPDDFTLEPADILFRRNTVGFSYSGAEFKPQYQDTLFGNAEILRGSMVLAPRGTSETFTINRGSEEETNFCFYPGATYVDPESYQRRTPLFFSVDYLMTSGLKSVLDGISKYRFTSSGGSLFSLLDMDFSDELFGQFRVITACMGYPKAMQFFPYSIPTVILKRWQNIQAQVSTLALSGKYNPITYAHRFELNISADADADPFIAIPDDSFICEINHPNRDVILDTVQVPGECFSFSSNVGISNLIFLPTSKILALSTELCSTGKTKLQIAGTSVEEILSLIYKPFSYSSGSKSFSSIEITAPVKKIAPWAFNLQLRGHIEKFTLPETLEILGAYALKNAPVKHLCLKGCEVIGEHALESATLLSRVDFPSNLKIIAEKAFGYCSRLKSVELSSCEKIEAEAFLGCEKLTSVTLPENLVEIGTSAFAGCVNLLEIVIPASCKKIGRDAFKDCASLTNLVFSGSPSGIELDKDAFSSCSYEIQKQVEPYIHRSRKRNA